MHTYTLLVRVDSISPGQDKHQKKVHGIYGCNLLKTLPDSQDIWIIYLFDLVNRNIVAIVALLCILVDTIVGHH